MLTIRNELFLLIELVIKQSFKNFGIKIFYAKCFVKLAFLFL